MRKLKSSSSLTRPSNSPPPKILRSSNCIINADARDDDYSSRRQLALVPPTTTTAATNPITSRYSGFKLPHGWGVQEVHRSDPSRVDKYYYEPGTGQKFRSLKAVERYVNGEEFTATPRALRLHNNYCKSARYRKMIICNGKMVRLNEETLSGSHLAIVTSGKTAAKSPYNLPDGWVVEEVPRRDDSHTDKYYHEPGSGQKFRSFVAAQRYIAELKEDVPLSAAIAEIKEMNMPLSKAFKLGKKQNKRSNTQTSSFASPPMKNYSSCKKQNKRSNTQTLSFTSPPTKVNWVLASPRGNAWNPFIFDSEIPGSVKQQWNERFILAMKGNNCDTLR